MNFYEPSEVKSLRRKLGFTQSQLAKASSVSQSLIAKIESDSIDPTYSNMSKISNAIDSLQKKESLQAKDFIHKGIIYCLEDDAVKDVIKKMKSHEISQLPVMKNDKVVGVVSETIIITHLIESDDKDLIVKDVMGDVPPIVSLNSPEEIISNLLKFFSLVIVQDKGELKGIITRADLIRKIYS